MVHDIFALKQPVIIWPYPDDISRINAAAQKPDDRVHSRFACPDNGKCVMLWRMARRGIWRDAEALRNFIAAHASPKMTSDRSVYWR
jgi:hypothetical protein